jgi:hypothetical protein
MEHQQPRIFGRDVEIVIEAALLATGRRADGEQRLAQGPPVGRVAPDIGAGRASAYADALGVG